MYRRVSLVILTIFLFAHCGSLLSELDRIRNKAEASGATSPDAAPTVVATDPADNSFGPYNQTHIDVTYSVTIDAGSISVQSAFGSCSGNLQVSYDGFQNCLGGTLDTSGNPRIRFTPLVFLRGIGLQLRTLTGIAGTTGIAAVPYTMATGFRLGAPCGNQHCFFSYSTPLMAPAGGNSGIFLIRSGVNSGKYLVYSTSGPTTTLIDPINGTSETGPNLAPCFTPGAGAHSFYVSSGTHAGKEILIRSGASTATCLYDPVSAIFTTVGAPTLPGNANAGGFSIQPDSGPDAGNTWIFRGGSTDLWRYNAIGGTITDTGQDTSFNVGIGSHSVRLATGTNAGQYLVYVGGFSVTSFLDPATSLLTVAPNISGTAGNGALSFEVTTGALAGRVITGIGSNTSVTSVFNTSAFAVGSAGPGLTGGSLTVGGLLLKQAGTTSENYPLILLGDQASNLDYLTNIFNPTTGTFAAGPTTTGPIAAGSSSIWVPSNTYSNLGGFLIVNGNTSSTSIYLPHNNTFHGSRMPTDVPSIGSSAYPIVGGIHDGKTLIVGGNGTMETAIYDPLTHQMSRGPNTTANGSATSFGIKIEQGTQANKILVFYGGGSTAFNVYDPATNLFSVPGGWPTAGTFGVKNGGAVAFMNKTNSKIVLPNGGNTSVVQTLDQATGIAAAASPMTCSPNGVALTLPFTVLSTGQQLQLVYCQGAQFSVYDHASETFTTTINSVSAGGLGLRAFVIPGGAQIGKVLIVHGGNLLTTSLLNPETNGVVAGPTLPTSCGALGVGDGSQVLPLTTGNNKGKVLFVTGNGQSTTCMYDPATHSFSQGPDISSTPSPGYQALAGSIAFRTNGGVYPTAFVLISGTGRNAWSTYVP